MNDNTQEVTQNLARTETRKSIAIIYFSGTGNTKAVTEVLANELALQATVTIIKVEDILKQKLSFDSSKFDMIGLGYPIHGFDPAKSIYHFVNALERADNMKTFIYFTCAGPTYLNANSTLLLKRKLRKKGFNVFYERMFFMPANFATQYNDEVCKQLYIVAIPKMKQMANDILLEKLRLRKDPYFVRILLSWLYFFEKLGWKFIGKDYKVRETCNLCMKCIKLCPQDNIVLRNNKISFKWDCMGCYRCVYSCPQNAITGRLFKLFIFKNGYNIQEIIDNDELEGNYITKKTKGYYRLFLKYLNDLDV